MPDAAQAMEVKCSCFNAHVREQPLRALTSRGDWQDTDALLKSPDGSPSHTSNVGVSAQCEVRTSNGFEDTVGIKGIA